MQARRREVLRRLGHPRFRVVCPGCKSYVSAVAVAFVWDDGVEGGMRQVEVCEVCRGKIDAQNREMVRRAAENQVALERANREYVASMQRASSLEYLAACERMRREGW